MPLWDTQHDEYRMVFFWNGRIKDHMKAIEALTIGKQLNQKSTDDDIGPLSSIYNYTTHEDAAVARADPKIVRFFADYHLCADAFVNGMPVGFDKYLLIIKRPCWNKRSQDVIEFYTITGKIRTVNFERMQDYSLVAVRDQGQTIEQLPIPKLLKSPPNKRQTLRDAIYPTVLEI
jgi:hypothetical protein